MQTQNSSLVTYAVFVFALVIVLINLVSLVFPSLFVTVVNESATGENPYEIGAWAAPLIITNIGVLIFAILFYKNKLPSAVKKSVKFIYNFEVSKNVAAFVFIILFFGYIGFAMSDIGEDEGDTWGDYPNLLGVIEKWPQGEGGRNASLEVLHVKNFLIKSSIILFDNPKIIPFLESISLVILTYFFTVQIAQKRFAGLVAMIVLIQSYTFLRFDTLMTYANDWTLFYLLSLYLILKKWPLSPVSYIASIFSKPLTAAFLPITLFFTYRAEIPRRKKYYILISYVSLAIIIGGGLVYLGADIGGGITTGKLTFNSKEFWAALTTWSFQLKFDTLFLLFILPVIVGLFLKSRDGIKQADSVMILIVGVILSMPLLAAITGFNLHPYRYVPLVVFFAIGVGMLFSNKVKQEA